MQKSTTNNPTIYYEKVITPINRCCYVARSLVC